MASLHEKRSGGDNMNKSGRFWMTCISAAAMALAFSSTLAQAWEPTKPIFVIVGTPPGGPLDGTARLVAQYLEKATGQPVNVVNKPGGGHAIAMSYLNQVGRDGHALSMALTNLITNRITGTNPLTYTDVTPLALLTSEYIGMSVKADSPIKDGPDLIKRLQADPASLTFAITNRAGGNHIAATNVMRASGVDLKKVKFVSFNGGAETVTAVMGGHVDVALATPGSVWKHVESGAMRMLAISAPKRLDGEISSVPTWKELGVDAVTPNWRSIVGAKGLTLEQVAYWDKTLAAMVQTPEWQKSLQDNQWQNEYLNSADTTKFMEQQYKLLETLLTESGDAKKE
jgi:putative tricarboxylic transport membrane protein